MLVVFKEDYERGGCDTMGFEAADGIKFIPKAMHDGSGSAHDVSSDDIDFDIRGPLCYEGSLQVVGLESMRSFH